MYSTTLVARAIASVLPATPSNKHEPRSLSEVQQLVANPCDTVMEATKRFREVVEARTPCQSWTYQDFVLGDRLAWNIYEERLENNSVDEIVEYATLMVYGD